MGTGSMLLKGHRHRPLGIKGLGDSQRLTAALPRVQGEGLQRQTAQQQQAEVVSARGRAKPCCRESGNRIQHARTLNEGFPGKQIWLAPKNKDDMKQTKATQRTLREALVRTGTNRNESIHGWN